MRISTSILAPGLFAFAALLALLGARISVGVIERVSVDYVQDALVLQGYEWAATEADGLQVVLSGTAPSEIARFRALATAGTVVDATRVIDNMTVPAAEAIQPPHFSIEILRNDEGISLIGLIPADVDREALTKEIKDIAGSTHITDLMGVADHPVPKNWDDALKFAMTALGKLPRSKISMDADRVAITAISDSSVQKSRWERELKRAAPRSLLLSMNISAPRPVITPFTLRFLIDEDGARFDACSAHDTVGRARILSAAAEVGLEGSFDCTIGLGVPSPDWADAVTAAIRKVGELKGGSVTFSDADVTFVAAPGTTQSMFDRAVGELESDLPDLYSVHGILPEVVKIDGSGEGDGPPEFVATLSPEGQMQLRGRLTNELQRGAAESYARARFGVANVYAATRLDPELPAGWPTRVLAALEALGHLNSGAIVVQPDVVDVRGNTGDPDAGATISRILSEKLGASQNFQVDVTYQKALDPVLGLPTPQECVSQINEILATRKIAFAPGSANIEASAGETIDKIAELLKKCDEVRMEIAGYTDSQGREEMNRSLSQTRAQAVLTALLSRRVLTSNLVATGYGEEDPIADNGSEEGREANRRIEFRLLDAGENSETQAAAEGEAAPSQPAPDGTQPAAGDTASDALPTEDLAAEGPPQDGAPMEQDAELEPGAESPPIQELTQEPAQEGDAQDVADPTGAQTSGDIDTPAALVSGAGSEAEERVEPDGPSDTEASDSVSGVITRTPGEGDPRPAPRPETSPETSPGSDPEQSDQTATPTDSATQ